MRRNSISWLLFFSIILLSFNLSYAQNIPTPEEFFGFRMGAEGELIHWNKALEYFDLLSQRSDKVIVQDLGESTLGNKFILVIFSSPENLRNLDKNRRINKQLADPRGLSENEIENLIKEGKYVSAQSYSLHATEVGGINCTPELAYELVTSNDETIRMILENTIFLMFPSFNPDGAIMVNEWFYKYKGTEFNNTRLPYLYHFHTGHDNNRDSYMLTQNESRMFAKIVYRDWVPQSFVDHHHMGSSGARFYIPPYLDPLHPNVDPLIWREHQLYGSHMAASLDNAGKMGIETGAPYTGWWQASFHMSTNYHNIAGMLTESASANWADPIYILPDELRGTRGRPEYKPQMSMPRPWPGGWWKLRDIVDNKLIASKAVLELGARYKEAMLRNMVLKAQGNIDRGTSEPPYAYILPIDQHDFPTAVKLVKTFQLNGVEVNRLDKEYREGSRVYAPGSFVISCAQPMRAFVKSFLEQINYPDNTWTRSHGDQSPIRPYDLAGYSVSEHMGVEAVPMLEPLMNIEMSVLDDFAVVPKGTVNGNNTFFLKHDSNESIRALNRLLKDGYEAGWTKLAYKHNDDYFPPGTFFIKGGSGINSYVKGLADDLGLDFYSTRGDREHDILKLNKVRLGLYKRYAGGNMDEGWTNWLLKDWEFDFTSLFNNDIKDSQLHQKYDVIVIPSDDVERVVNGSSGDDIPPEYRGGIGNGGIENIRRFVEEGGTLVTLNSAWSIAREVFSLPLNNIVENVPAKDFYCPGSTLKISVDTEHPVCYGMPQNALALFFRGTPVLTVSSGDFGDRVSVPVRYHEENIMQSGWLIGEKYLSQKPAVIEFKIGEGKVVVIAFPAQHRAQTHGTFKFLFNAIYYGAAEDSR